MSSLLSDIKYAIRQLRKKPGFTIVVVLSLALGIGANATALCWLQNLVLRPLPGIVNQEEMVVLTSNQGGGCVSLPDLQGFGRLDEVFVGTLASEPTPASLSVNKQPEWVEAQIVSANFFDLLGVKPILGRTFRPDEDQKPGGNPVLVISETLWRQRFGGDQSVIGRVVDLNRHSFTIIGVVPASFKGTMAGSKYDLWAPSSMIWEVGNESASYLVERDARGWHNLARLRPGVSLEQAQAAVTLYDAQLTQAYPDNNRGIHHRVLKLSQCPWGAQSVAGPAMLLLLIVSLGVQLIVTANIANMFLARTLNRQKEIAIRLAAGAGRGRLIRQFLTESVLLAILGGGAGVMLANQTVDFIPLFLPAGLSSQGHFDFALDSVTLGLTLLLILGTGVAFGLIPAFHVTRPKLSEMLKQGGRLSKVGTSHHRIRNSLVVAEVALALILLVCAGLCVRGLGQARKINFGFNPNRVLIARLRIGMNGYQEKSGQAFYSRLQQHIAALPEVEEAALASWFPLGLQGCKGWDAHVPGYQPPVGQDMTYEYAIVSPQYFAVMQVPLLAGRDFTNQDNAQTQAVAVINEAFAQRFWPDQEPIGRKFRTGGVWRTVIGVAQQGKYNRVDEGQHCFFYLPYQQGVPELDLDLCIRTQGDPMGLAQAVRQAIHELDPHVDILYALPLAQHTQMALIAQSMTSTLLILLGGVALALATMGVYAVMAYMVTQHTQEFGVRMALGAQISDILKNVLVQGLKLAGIGVFIGLVMACVLTHWMKAFLYGVSPFDPVTFVGVPIFLIFVSMLACLFPAQRAARVDPMEALRYE